MIIRTAIKEDLTALLDIYNYEVLYGIATFDLHPKTIEERILWFEAHNIDNHPLLTAEEDGNAVGYASLSEYREKEAFRTTVELSVYIDPAYRGKGIASALMAEILKYAREREDIHTVVSVITAGNKASVHLHEKFGFTFCGTMHEVGMKFGKYLDIENYELRV